MNDASKRFLMELLETNSPSGYEEPAARRWRAEADEFADEVTVDSLGNSFARLRGDGPKVVFAGHMDEIGLQVSYVDDQGYLWFQGIGGWDDQVLTGQHVRVITDNGVVSGVVGRRPAHLLSADERGKASRIKDLWIDIGALDSSEAKSLVQPGDAVVIDRPVTELQGGIIAGRGLDNRVGSFVALEALRRLADDRPVADVYALGAVQEEIGFRGAQTAAFGLDPDVAIVLDVCHATDHPNADKHSGGDVKVNAGPALARGSVVHPGVHQMLADAAREAGIGYSIDLVPRSSGTDADAVAPSRAGIPCGIVSFPCRYMHSPSELVSLSDLDQSAELLAQFARRVGSELDLRRV
ncbi:MAG: M42 family metallopeptidase [Thermomicrobiaceae bacterium]